jgi:hypothetical protein
MKKGATGMAGPMTEARKQAARYLDDCLTRGGAVRPLMEEWPDGYSDELLDDILNTLIEFSVDSDAIPLDIARIALQAITEGWDCQRFGEALDEMEASATKPFSPVRVIVALVALALAGLAIWRMLR